MVLVTKRLLHLPSSTPFSLALPLPLPFPVCALICRSCSYRYARLEETEKLTRSRQVGEGYIIKTPGVDAGEVGTEVWAPLCLPAPAPILPAYSLLGGLCDTSVRVAQGWGWLKRALEMAGRRNKRAVRQWKVEVRGASSGKLIADRVSWVQDF